MKKIFLLVTLLVALTLGWYGISPIFITVELDEAAPEQMEMETEAAQVVGTTGHPASGVVRVIEADGKTYVRYEDFETLNGPDLFVYLAKDLNADEFVNLGRLRATEGNINYEVPPGVDVDEYPFVLVWCRAFGVLFNYADVSLTQ